MDTETAPQATQRDALNSRIPAAMMARLRVLAEREMIPVSALVRQMLRDQLDRRERDAQRGQEAAR
jgi:hypothetical protein